MSLSRPTIPGPDSTNAYGMSKLPPGQLHTEKFPVMTYGPTPIIERAEWRLELIGEVSGERVWTWEEFMLMPQTTLRSDFHCVTHWSRFDDDYSGVMFTDFYNVVKDAVDPDANYVMQHAYGGYTTNLPLQWMLDEDVMFVHTINGDPLPADHGGPMRIITPRRYGWKGAKWIRKIEFMTADRQGFWEQNGYSNTADPWTNDRYW